MPARDQMAPLLESLRVSLSQIHPEGLGVEHMSRAYSLLRNATSVLGTLEDAYIVLQPDVDYGPYTALIAAYTETTHAVMERVQSASFLAALSDHLQGVAAACGVEIAQEDVWWVSNLPLPYEQRRPLSWLLAAHTQADGGARRGLIDPMWEPELLTGSVLVRGPRWVHSYLSLVSGRGASGRVVRHAGPAHAGIGEDEASYLISLWRPEPANRYHDLNLALRVARLLLRGARH